MLGQLGIGAYARVMLAYDTIRRRKVAIKRYNAAKDGSAD